MTPPPLWTPKLHPTPQPPVPVPARAAPPPQRPLTPASPLPPAFPRAQALSPNCLPSCDLPTNPPPPLPPHPLPLLLLLPLPPLLRRPPLPLPVRVRALRPLRRVRAAPAPPPAQRTSNPCSTALEHRPKSRHPLRSCTVTSCLTPRKNLKYDPICSPLLSSSLSRALVLSSVACSLVAVACECGLRAGNGILGARQRSRFLDSLFPPLPRAVRYAAPYSSFV
jgi:hypothetical protein